MIFGKKHMLLFVSIALFAIMFSGCTKPATPEPLANETVYWPPSSGDNSSIAANATTNGNSGTLSVPCSDKSNVISKDECLVAKASDSKNSTLCGYIYSNSQKDKCMSYFEDGSVSYCGQYVDFSYRNLCLYKVALAKKSIGDCNTLDDVTLRSNCISALAQTCESESSDYLVKKCRAFKDSNPALCPDNSCIYDLAKNMSNVSVCDSLPSNESNAIIVSCRSFASDADLCSTIGNVVVKDYCYELWAEKKLSPDICAKASKDFNYQQKCYLNISIAKEDFLICLQNPSDLDDADCITQYAAATGKSEGCSRINEMAVTPRNRCYNEAAKTSKKASICNNIDVYNWKITCYSGLVQAGSLLDLNDCALISEDAWGERCLSTLAYQQQNKSVCDFIRSTDAISSCKNQFN